MGPVEYIVVGFPENRFSGDIIPALRDLVESGTIRILDLIFIMKDGDGEVAAVEVEDVPEFGEFLNMDVEVGGVIGDEDVEHIAAALEPNSAAGLLIWEDLWAEKFVDAVRGAGGVLIEGARVPAELVNDLEAAIAAK